MTLRGLSGQWPSWTSVGAVRQNGTVMKYIDLFAGCGGLSLGVEQAGGELVLAVEKSDMASRTFYHNLVGDASDIREWMRHVDSSVREQASSKVVVRELSALLAEESVMEQLSAEGIDLVVGGPPCQGFSLAGRRNPEDARNKLPWEYLQFVEKIQPKAVVIENVVGMNQRFSSDKESSFVQLQQALRETAPGYVVQGVHVNAMHYGAPQHRPRLMIIGIRSDVAAQKGIESDGMLWRSGFADEISALPTLAPRPTVTRGSLRTVQHAVADLFERSEIDSGNREYLSNLRRKEDVCRIGKTDNVLNHVLRKHAPKTEQRFRLYQYLSTSGLDQKVVSKAAALPISEATLYAKTQLAGAPMPAESPDGQRLAENLEELVDLVIELGTKKHSQKVLGWEMPARTVVTLPDDYVHPKEPRIFTVREMARFQGFPDNFEFLGKETTGAQRRRVEVPQYSQVGNAVSPWLSHAVGLRIAEVIA